MARHLPEERDGLAREVGAGMARLFSVAFGPQVSDGDEGGSRREVDPSLLPVRANFHCPITQDIMRDPVLTVDGCCYDRESILEWFERGNTTSPSTNLQLPSTDVIPCEALGATIQEYLRCRPEVRPREYFGKEREQEARHLQVGPNDACLQAGHNDAQVELASLRATVRSLADELAEAMGDGPKNSVKDAIGRVQRFLTDVSEEPCSQIDDTSCAFTPSEVMLSVGFRDGTLCLFDTHSGKRDWQMKVGGSITCSAWHPRAMLATGSDDGFLRFIDSRTGCAMGEVAHPDSILAIAWNPSGLSIATGCADHIVRVISAVSCRILREFRHSHEVRAVDWDPLGSSTLVTGCNDHRLRFFEGATGLVKHQVQHQGWVLCVAWRPSGGYVATGCGDGKLRILDATSGHVQPEVQLLDAVLAVAWCPTAHLVAAGCKDGVVRVFDAATGCVNKEVPHCAFVRAVAWHPDGRKLATGCGHGKLRIMDVATDRVLSEEDIGQVSALAWLTGRRSPTSASCGDEASCSRLVFAPTRRRKRQRSCGAKLTDGCPKQA